jgi:hypothetical protein
MTQPGRLPIRNRQPSSVFAYSSAAARRSDGLRLPAKCAETGRVIVKSKWLFAAVGAIAVLVGFGILVKGWWFIRGVRTLASEDTPLMPYIPRKYNLTGTARSLAHFLQSVPAPRAFQEGGDAGYAGVYVYANLDPRSAMPDLAIPGWDVTSIWAVSLAVVYKDAPSDTYWYNAQIHGSPAKSLPDELTVDLREGPQRTEVVVHRDPYEETDARLPIYSNYWLIHHPQFKPKGSPVATLPSPRLWRWISAVEVPGEESAGLIGLEYRPAPALYYFERPREPGHRAAGVAAWLPGTLGSSVDCVLRFRDGRQQRVHVFSETTVYGVKFTWNLPKEITTQLPATGF